MTMHSFLLVRIVLSLVWWPTSRKTHKISVGYGQWDISWRTCIYPAENPFTCLYLTHLRPPLSFGELIKTSPPKMCLFHPPPPYPPFLWPDFECRREKWIEINVRFGRDGVTSASAAVKLACQLSHSAAVARIVVKGAPRLDFDLISNFVVTQFNPFRIMELEFSRLTH